MAAGQRMRVVLATDSLAPSGVGEHMLTLAGQLARTHDLILAYPAGEQSEPFLSRAACLGFGVKYLDVENSAAITTWLVSVEADLLHIHAGIGWEGHGLARSGRNAKMPIVRTEHLPYLLTDPNQCAEYQDAIKLADAVITVSEGAAATYGEAGFAGEKFRTIRNGVVVPAACSSRAQVRESLGLPPQDLLILCVARFTPQKGHATLFAAMSELGMKGQAKLLLVGDGERRADMETMSAKRGLSGNVLFLGQRNDVPDLLAAADLFVLPSLFEGLPLAVLEAMALGVPVIATRIGGTMEALGSEHAWYSEPEDAVGLAAVMREALTDAGARRRVGAMGQQRYEAYFQASRMADQTAALYAEIGQSVGSSVKRAEKKMAKTRIGFIGAGNIARRHLAVLEGFEDVRIAALADADFGRAAEAAGRFGARAYRTHRDMLDGEVLDGVYLCVPPFAHGEPEQDLLMRAIPFFVEKPLSIDFDVALEIGRQIAREGLITGVGYHWRYLETIDEARQLLAGNPPHFLSGYWLDQTPPPQWWWRRNQSGGQMIEQATHVIDLMRLLAGDVVQVFGFATHRPRQDYPGLDIATASTASLRFASGAIGNIGATCLLRWGHRIGLHVFADRLAIELTERDIMVDVGCGRPLRHAKGDPVWLEDRDFIDAVRGGENRIRCPYQEALETHRVACAVARSADTGVPVWLDQSAAEAANG
jgi:predicted dehydrogenase/glycosyltransferase involved in cell wall biosynthesis